RCAIVSKLDGSPRSRLEKTGAGISATDAASATVSTRARPFWNPRDLSSDMADESVVQERIDARLVRRHCGAFVSSVGIAGFFRIRPCARECGTRRRLANSSRWIAINLQRARQIFDRARRRDRDRPPDPKPGAAAEIACDPF